VNNSSIDLLVHNSHHLSSNRERNTVIVVLNGAVNNRETKAGPFFSGIGISNSTNTPLFSFSDPTLELSDKLSIGWYCGYKDRKAIAREISHILDTFASDNNVDYFFIGGSAGGFGTLSVLKHLLHSSNALIWNPQIAIWRYWKAHVGAYLSCAYNKPITVENSEHAKMLCDAIGLDSEVHPHDVGNHSILYCQNESDKHVQSHMQPFMNQAKFTKINDSTFSFPGNNSFIWIGNWGDGHAPLPVGVVVDSVHCFKNAGNLSDIRTLVATALTSN